MAACVALSLLFTALVSWGVVRALISSPQPGAEELPLTAGDLTDGDFDYRQGLNFSQSPLLARLEAHQYPLRRQGMAKGPSVRYTVIVVKAPFLYGLCRDAVVRDRTDSWNRNLPEGEGYLYQSADPAPWGAAEAYQWTSRTSGAGNTYLLCYPGRIVEIEFDAERPPTSAQMAVVAEKLGRGPL